MIRAIDITPGRPPGPTTPEPQAGSLKWIDADASTPEILMDIAEQFDISMATMESIVRGPDRPELDSQGSRLHVALHSLSLDAEERVDTAEYDLLLGAGWLISFRTGPIPIIDWLWEELQQNTGLDIESPLDLVSLLALHGAHRFIPVVNAVAAQADALGVDALGGPRGILGEIQALLRAEVILRTAIRAQRGVIEQLAGVASATALAQERLGDAASVHRALVDDLLTARTILSDAVNTYRGAVAERTGDVTRVLTVYAAIVLPMTLVAGIWGMNLDALPFTDTARGFAIVLVIMLAIGVLSMVAFVRFGYVAPPARPDPRWVTSLLGDLVRLPIRAVRWGGDTLRPRHTDSDLRER